LPKYVRLPDELYLGIVADINSGWKISGLEVKETPSDENDPAFKFVRTALRAGRIEPASREEFEFLQNHYAEVTDMTAPVAAGEAQGTWNEPAIAKKMRDDRRELVRLRNADHARRQGDENEDGEESEYSGWTDRKLKEEAKRRDLDTSGERSDLIARLEASDS
jgi:hypothetical protein